MQSLAALAVTNVISTTQYAEAGGYAEPGSTGSGSN
jgi:hypothetical protein